MGKRLKKVIRIIIYIVLSLLSLSFIFRSVAGLAEPLNYYVEITGRFFYTMFKINIADDANTTGYILSVNYPLIFLILLTLYDIINLVLKRNKKVNS